MTRSDAWEPWVPEVGQRVRVRVSAECRALDSHQLCDKYLDHRPIGVVYRVVTIDDPYSASHARAGHPYWVTHDFVPVPDKPFHGLYGGYFSAFELEPSEEPDAADQEWGV